jgi:hypothetical protein
MFQHVRTVLAMLDLSDHELEAASPVWPLQVGEIQKEREKRRSLAFQTENPVCPLFLCVSCF